MKLTKKLSIIVLTFIAAVATLIFGLQFAGKQTFASAEKADVSHYYFDQLVEEGKPQESALRQNFYKAMEKMYKDGLFIEGEDLDLTENGFITQRQLENYSETDIVRMMGAARDAFYTDYNEIFYVDFGYLSLRVTTDVSGSYHVYMGSGRADTYFTTGFNSPSEIRTAISKYETALNAVVAEAKAAKPTDKQISAFGKDVATTVARIQYAHGWIAENAIYKLESTCTPGNEGHVRTPYGVFVAKHDDGTQNKFLDKDQGEALCEGYSRAFKAVMDKLGIPCVLINGVYRHAENQEELHMWCYVQLNGEWYAVDQTFDDINRRSAATGVLLTGLGNAYTEDYFLKGYSLMNTQHATSPYKSEAEYPFTYPQLAYHNLGSEVSTEHGAMIRVEQEPYSADMSSTTIKVSVFVEETDDDVYGLGNGRGKWCSYSQAAQKGLYLVVRYEGNYLPEQVLRANGGDLSGEQFDTDKKKYENAFMSWAYVNPIQGLYEGFIDDYETGGYENGGYTVMRDTMKPYGYEFAVTTVAPRPYDRNETNLDRIAEMTSFLGDPTMFVARSGFIKTLYSDPDYNPPPFIVKATPSSWGKLSIGKGPYNITVEYDQYLKLAEGDSQIQMSVVGMRATGEFVKGTNAVVLEKVVDLSTLKWDRGEGTKTKFIRGGRISFKFTPSPEYAHDNIMYYFSFNLVGENSGKQVNPVEYAAGYESDAMCYKANGFHWSVYAQPQLVESGDLSTEGWTTSDGTDLSETKSRLALVVTSPSKKQNSQMNDLLEDELGLSHQEDGELNENAFESFTYNISLTICKGVSIQTGQGVRIGIGFPEGFTYDDSMDGVVFEAYHFIRDAQNNVIDVEKLEVTVTPLGLIIIVYSFSPFAIVVKHGETPVNTDKTVIISNTSGGTAYANVDGKKSNMFSVKESNKTSEVTINANAGYVIETVKVNGEVVELNKNNLTAYSLNLDYDNLDAQNVVEVKFVSAQVKAKEEERGELPIVQQLKAAEISIDEAKKSFTVTAGKALVLEPSVKAYGDTNTYQWYKDGVALEGKTGSSLRIEHVSDDDAGVYTLKVTSMSGLRTVTATSEAIEVGVKPAPAPSGSIVGVVISIIVGVAVIAAATVAVIIVMKRKKNA